MGHKETEFCSAAENPFATKSMIDTSNCAADISLPALPGMSHRQLTGTSPAASMSGEKRNSATALARSRQGNKRTKRRKEYDSSSTEGGEDEHSKQKGESSDEPDLEPKPKRPLSAYNLFFRHERARLLMRQNANSSNDNADAGVVSAEDTLNQLPPLKDTAEVPLRDSIRILLENNPHHTDRKTRVHRKTHGMISFTQLVKVMSDAWKRCDEDVREIFEDLADEGRNKYKEDVRAWKVRVKKQKKLVEEMKAKREAVDASKNGQEEGNAVKEEEQEEPDEAPSLRPDHHAGTQIGAGTGTGGTNSRQSRMQYKASLLENALSLARLDQSRHHPHGQHLTGGLCNPTCNPTAISCAGGANNPAAVPSSFTAMSSMSNLLNLSEAYHQQQHNLQLGAAMAAAQTAANQRLTAGPSRGPPFPSAVSTTAASTAPPGGGTRFDPDLFDFMSELDWARAR